MSDFADRPFVAGTLTGIRAFKPQDGWLRAPVNRTSVWRPGENVAECVPQPFSAFNRDDPHQVAGMGCRCGFYAYFHAGYNPHQRPGDVLGLIQGYGVVTVGTRGFRCEKARIVALIAPDVPNFDLGFVFANYPGVALFNSVEEAVAEFPLTVPEGTPDVPPLTGTLTAWINFTVNTAGFAQQMKTVMESINAVAAKQAIEFAKLGERLRAVVHDETHQFRDEEPMERALRLRRTRNTGPEDPYRLTGRRRRNHP